MQQKLGKELKHIPIEKEKLAHLNQWRFAFTIKDVYFALFLN